MGPRMVNPALYKIYIGFIFQDLSVFLFTTLIFDVYYNKELSD